MWLYNNNSFIDLSTTYFQGRAPGQSVVGMHPGPITLLKKFFIPPLPPPPPSQLHCVHFGSWDSNRDWSVSLTAKESIRAIAVGDGWIAIATNKQMLRLFSVGGVQREVISVPGHPVTLSGWGGRLAIVYQAGPCKLKI